MVKVQLLQVMVLMQNQKHLLRLVEILLLSVKKVLQLVKIQRLPQTVVMRLQSVFHQFQMVQTQQRLVLMQEAAMLTAWH